MNLTSEEFQELLDDLLIAHGKWANNKTGRKCRYIDDTKRYETIVILLETLRDRGVEKEWIQNPSRQDTIAECYFPEHRTDAYTSKKRNGVMKMVRDEIRLAIREVWNLVAEDVSSKELKPIEVAPYEPPKSTSKTAPAPEPAKGESQKFAGRDVDPKLYEKDVALRPELDEEFAALIGLKKDE